MREGDSGGWPISTCSDGQMLPRCWLVPGSTCLYRMTIDPKGRMLSINKSLSFSVYMFVFTFVCGSDRVHSRMTNFNVVVIVKVNKERKENLYG